MKGFSISEAFLKGVTVAGIAIVWFELTLKSLGMSWHIISTSPEEYNSSFDFSYACEVCDCDIEEGNGIFLCNKCKNGGENDYFK